MAKVLQVIAILVLLMAANASLLREHATSNTNSADNFFFYRISPPKTIIEYYFIKAYLEEHEQKEKLDKLTSHHKN
jgi:hypothetical protein